MLVFVFCLYIYRVEICYHCADWSMQTPEIHFRKMFEMPHKLIGSFLYHGKTWCKSSNGHEFQTQTFIHYTSLWEFDWVSEFYDPPRLLMMLLFRSAHLPLQVQYELVWCRFIPPQPLAPTWQRALSFREDGETFHWGYFWQRYITSLSVSARGVRQRWMSQILFFEGGQGAAVCQSGKWYKSY